MLYIIQGEVRINEDQLNSFLHTAKSLGIRGLMGDGKNSQTESAKKRKWRTSEEHTSDQEESSSIVTSPPPPPPLLKHKTSLTRPPSFEVKCELSADQEEKFQSTVSNLQSEMESMTQNSSIHSGPELEDDELDLFQQCSVPTTSNTHHPSGSSRLSAEELHSSGQGN